MVLENEMEHSVNEESHVLEEFRKLFLPISNHLDIHPQTDRLLMDLNSAAEVDTGVATSSNAEVVKGRLKILENPAKVAGA